MKKLMCELCGSVDIVKDGDYFVCQNCGTKYTVEAAKKMLIEGTVKIDQSDKFKNLVSLAKSEIIDGRFDNAYAHSTEAMTINPNDAEIVAINGLAFLGKEDIVTDIPSSCTNSMKRMFVLLDKNTDISYDDKKGVLNSIKKCLKSVDIIISRYNEQIRILNSQKVIVYDVPMDTVSLSYSGYIANKQYAEAKLEQRNAQIRHNNRIEAQITKIKEIKGKIVSFCNTYQSAITTKLTEYDLHDRIHKEEQRKKYWEEHSDEKNELNLRLLSLQKELKPILDSITQKQNDIRSIEKTIQESTYPLSEQRDHLKDKIRELEHKRAHLNILQLFEKNRITEEIASIRESLPTDQEIIDEIKSYNMEKLYDIEKIKNEISLLQKQAGDIKQQIEIINSEFRKDR